MTTLETSDADLVAQCLAGNRASFENIVSRYQGLICSITYSATGNINQSEDLAQDTFITAWRELGRLREPEKLRPWLCRISRNLSFDALKKQGREPSHDGEALDELTDLSTGALQPNEETISREEQEILWRAIGQIDEIYREPLILFYRENQSIESVAAHLDLTEDAVKQRLSRGRKLLQEQILSFVQNALAKTSPGKAFTVGVIAALPAFTISAKAAAVGATAAKGSAAAKAAGVTAISSILSAPLMAFVGNYFGYRMSMEMAQSQAERDFIKRFYRNVMLIAVGFAVVFGLLVAWLSSGHARFALPLIVGSVIIYTAVLLAYIRNENAQRRILFAAAQKLNPTQTKPLWIYRSSLEFLGLPLVNIRLGERFSSLKKPVVGWIAIGDYAIGGFFGFGAIAIAPISFAALGVGLVSYAGAAVGALAMGGMALGYWSFGGLALGWLSYGGCAGGWKAAVGGAAFAHDMALGGFAQGMEANSDAAREFVTSNTFFHWAQFALDHYFVMNLLWVIPMLVFWQIVRRKQRQRNS